MFPWKAVLHAIAIYHSCMSIFFDINVDLFHNRSQRKRKKGEEERNFR